MRNPHEGTGRRLPHAGPEPNEKQPGCLAGLLLCSDHRARARTGPLQPSWLMLALRYGKVLMGWLCGGPARLETCRV